MAIVDAIVHGMCWKPTNCKNHNHNNKHLDSTTLGKVGISTNGNRWISRNLSEPELTTNDAVQGSNDSKRNGVQTDEYYHEIDTRAQKGVCKGLPYYDAVRVSIGLFLNGVGVKIRRHEDGGEAPNNCDCDTILPNPHSSLERIHDGVETINGYCYQRSNGGGD